MKLSNIKVYDLEESICASGFPMSIEPDSARKELTPQDFKRIFGLTRASHEDNRAHGQWLTGIRVAFDLTFTNKAWVEAERYRFLEFVSSQSTMHRITSFDIKSQCNKYVDPRIIEILEEKVTYYKVLKEELKHASEDASKEALANQLAEAYLDILYNIPSGFELTARMTTNYRCLLNIFEQRWDHRLPEWREFCRKLLTLPYFKELLEVYRPDIIEKLSQKI